MNNTPLVSIITIVYNGEKFIEKTIQSVLNQSYTNIEYIIIDGLSKDNTVQIIKKYADKLAYWCSEKDNGISDAFNKGIKHASGELVGLINADDWYEPDAVENIVSAIGTNDIAYGNLRYWKQGEIVYIQKGNHQYLTREMTVNHPTVFVRKSAYQKYGTFDQSLKCAMDYDLLLRMLTEGNQFVFVDKLIANMNLEGISDKNWLLGCKESLQIKNKYLPERKLMNRMYFYKHVFAIWFSKFLHQIGLKKIIKQYRLYFSMLKKEY